MDMGLGLSMLEAFRGDSTPTVGFHLDRWWGLPREKEILTHPFFRVDHLFTADGAHDDRWRAAELNHTWSPPAVLSQSCVRGYLRPEYVCDVAFVGSWNGYHPEWRHRMQLVKWLVSTYGDRLKLFPQPGKPAVRNHDLNDLYCSAKVIVGDSCLVPTADGGAMHSYVSDRVFETVGRGGFLIHPHVDGVFPDLLEDGKHLRTYPLGDFDALRSMIDHYLEYELEREEIALTGMDHVRAHHTYAHRLERVLAVVEEGRLAA